MSGAWTRISEDHFERELVMGLSRDARLLDIEGKVYSNRLLTDGAVPRRAMRRITDSEAAEEAVQELIDADQALVNSGGTAGAGDALKTAQAKYQAVVNLVNNPPMATPSP